MKKLLALFLALWLATPAFADMVTAGPGTPGGGGTVTSFSSGNLSTWFNTSVATPTTTPALSFHPTGAAGDIPYFSALNTAANLGIGTTGYVLTVVGGVPAWAAPATSGTVTSFSAGDLSPLFTTSVANPTTTPALTFSLSNAASGTLFGNFTGASGAPSFNAEGTNDQVLGVVNTGTGLEYKTIAAGTGISVIPTAGTITIATTAGTNPVTILDSNITPVGNVDGSEDDLITYSLPGATLATNTDAVEIEAFGTLAANGNSKEVKIYFGATVLFDSGAAPQNGGDWNFKAKVIRTGAATQIASTIQVANAISYQTSSLYTTPAETLSGPVTIKCTGTGVAVNDIIEKYLSVTYYKGP